MGHKTFQQKQKRIFTMNCTIQSYTIKCVETYVNEIDMALIQQESMGFVKMLIPIGTCNVQILHYPGII